MTQPTLDARDRRRLVLIVSVAAFLASLDLFIVNIAFPAIAEDFAGSDLGSLSWVLNAYAIVYAALLVPAGRWSDRLGHKRVFIGGLLGFVTASALCAAAPSVQWLVAARVLQAAGAAALTPASLAILLPAFPPERRAMAIGIWAAIGAVAAAAGPPLGGLLAGLSWHWVFLVNLPIGLVAAVAAHRVLRESRAPDPGPRPDTGGSVLLVAGVGLLILAIVQGPDWGWDETRGLAAFAASFLLLGGFALRTSRHASPVVDPAMLRVRSFAVASLAGLAFFAAFGAMLLAGVLFLTEVWGHSILRAGLELSPGPAMAAIFAVASSRFGDRIGPRALAVPGAVIFAAGVTVWIWRVTPEPSYLTAYLPGMLLTGTGVGLALPSLSSAAMGSLPPARLATGVAVFTMSRQLGSALGVAILVAVVGTPAPADALAAFDRGWIVIASGALLAALAAAALGPAEARAVTIVGRVAAGPAPVGR